MPPKHFFFKNRLYYLSTEITSCNRRTHFTIKNNNKNKTKTKRKCFQLKADLIAHKQLGTGLSPYLDMVPSTGLGCRGRRSQPAKEGGGRFTRHLVSDLFVDKSFRRLWKNYSMTRDVPRMCCQEGILLCERRSGRPSASPQGQEGQSPNPRPGGPGGQVCSSSVFKRWGLLCYL